jgi:prepilin-type processing-associated H-X9-DG protein
LANDQGIGWADSEGAFSLDGSSRDGMREGCGVANDCHVAMNARNDNEPFAFHTGGSTCLFADGHVQFQSQEIDIALFAALCTRAAGEIVSVPD